MKFWDTSALVPLIITESTTPRAREAYIQDNQCLVWWGTYIECASAICRKEREGVLRSDQLFSSFAALNKLSGTWQEIEATQNVRDNAIRALRIYNLRAADAMQLGALVHARQNMGLSLDFVCFDERLIIAAQKEGFDIWGSAR